jgi:hypothetical protein
LITLANGAKQFVVQDALETIVSVALDLLPLQTLVHLLKVLK